MAKPNTPEKEQQTGFFRKIGRFFKNLGLGIARSFKEMFSELKKVTWPTRKELVNYTLVVLAFMTMMGIIIGVLDAGAAWLVSALIRV
ncbi:preprotein translocase subunit SecE [Bacillota bacterium Meth-B3]|nr:preprotein translocase subunit SecE [Christensenellaceae bacterium]MEA5068604.1 preprotein translocase subunit SecE [Christensenellaceae bacterium]